MQAGSNVRGVGLLDPVIPHPYCDDTTLIPRRHQQLKADCTTSL